MAGIKYHKKRQFVRNFFRDVRFYHPAYVREVGFVKVLKYPQEYTSADHEGGDRLTFPGSHK